MSHFYFIFMLTFVLLNYIIVFFIEWICYHGFTIACDQVNPFVSEWYALYFCNLHVLRSWWKMKVMRLNTKSILLMNTLILIYMVLIHFSAWSIWAIVCSFSFFDLLQSVCCYDDEDIADTSCLRYGITSHCLWTEAICYSHSEHIHIHICMYVCKCNYDVQYHLLSFAIILFQYFSFCNTNVFIYLTQYVQ